MNPTLEELEAREREVFAAFVIADNAAVPFRNAWVEAMRVVQKERLRLEVLAELKATYRGEERLPG